MAQVSIIIPTYNRVAWVPKAIESAKAAGKDVEVIVVDNGSTDETPEVCRDIPGIRYLRLHPNVRQAGARNEGIRSSTGKFLTFLDDDDQRLPNSLDRQVKLLDSNPDLGFVYGRVLLGDQNCMPTGKTSPERCERGDLFWTLLEGNFIHLHAVVARRELIEEVGCFDPKLVGAEDWMLLLRLSEHHPVDAVEEPVAIYRNFTSSSGQTSSNRVEMCKAAAAALEEGLQLQRSREAPGKKRRALRRRFLDILSAMLVDDTAAALYKGNYRSAFSSYATALKLDPSRNVHPYTLKLLLSATRRRDNDVAD